MPVLRRVGAELGAAVVTFAVLGVVAGLLWWRLADPPYYVRTAQGAVMDQAQLARRVHADGTFLVVGLVASLVGAAVLWRLSRRRDGDALLGLLLGTVAAAAAGLLALWLGRTLGHVDVRAAVRAAKVGGHVTDTLTVISPAVVLVWPIGYLLLSVGLLWGTSDKPPASDWESDTMVTSTHPGGTP